MTDYPWFKIDVQETIALTDPWTDEQAGAHQRLCLYAWTRGGLPLDLEAVRRIRRWTPTQWKRVWPVIGQEWIEMDGRLVHPPMEAKRQDAVRFKDAMREAGRRGGSQAQARLKPGSSQDGARLDHREREKREERDLDQDGRERGTSLSLVTVKPEPGGYELSPGQLQAAVPGLVGAWNNLCAVEGSPFQVVTARSHPKATTALRAHPDINWWADLFVRVGASDYLSGRVPGRDGTPFVADFWWVLDRCEPIASGRYDNRAHLSRNGAALAEALKGLA